MHDEFIEKFVDEAQKATYYSIVKKLTTIVDAPIYWPKHVYDGVMNDIYPFYPYDDYVYLRRIDERGELWTKQVGRTEHEIKERCHINCIRYHKEDKNIDIFTGFAYSEEVNCWVRHSWLYKPVEGIILETTGTKFVRYYGYRLDESEIAEFDRTYNNEISYKLDGSMTFEIKYLGNSS